MKNLCFAFFCILSGYSIAQPIDFVYRDSILNKRSIQITGLNTFASNAVKNELFGKFLLGGNISTEMIDNNAPKDFNVLGGEAIQNISYFDATLLKLPNLGILISASDHHFLSTSYKPSIFNLAFRGNAPYVGDTLDLSYAHAQYLHFQNYGIGVFDKRTQSFIKVGFLVGNRSLNYRAGETYFHTTEDGSKMYLDLNFDGHSTQFDSTNSYLTAKGYGFSLELNHNFIINTKSGRQHIVNFNLSNIGSIFWNSNTANIKMDSIYSYQGFDYSELSSVQNMNSSEVLDSLGLLETAFAKREALPIKIIINKVPIYNFNRKLQSTFGFKALLIPDYRPMLYGGIHYQPSPYFSLATKAIIGGYGSLRFALNANLWIKNNFYLGLSTLDIIGLGSNTIGKGKSLNITMQLNL
ncbi:MAG: hypothetical protein AB8B74_12905 [Crocinitomicaceae bacterium]